MNYEGWFNIGPDGVIHGWAWDQDSPDKHVKVGLYADKKFVTEVIAHAYRPDLRNNKIGEGDHGFQLDSKALNLTMGADVQMKVMKSKFYLRSNSTRLYTTLYFVHLPKCGGTSLRSFLEDNYPAHLVMPDNMTLQRYGNLYPPAKVLAAYDKMDRAKYKLLRGHYHVDYGFMLPGKTTLLTVLREPVARTISHIKMMIRDSARFAHHTVDSFVEEHMELQNNMMTRFFCKQVYRHEMDRVPDQFRLLDYIPVDVPLNDNDGVVALKNLERVQFVGIQDDLDRFAQCVAKELNLKGVNKLPKLNAHPSRSKYAPETLERIREHNQYDIHLYEEAQRRSAALLDAK